MDRREQQLLAETASKVTNGVDILSIQEKTLTDARGVELQKFCDHTEQVVRLGTDNEFMSVHVELKRRVEKKIEECCKAKGTHAPLVEADIGVVLECAEELQQLCETHAQIIQLPLDIKCAILDHEGTHEVGKVSSIPLIVRLSNNKITRRKWKVTASLEFLHSGDITASVVDRTLAGDYSIRLLVDDII